MPAGWRADMADGSTIEWTDATWQPITGCSIVSPGCTNCYAMKLAGGRLKRHPSRKGLTQDSKAGPVWTGEVRFNEQWLAQPLKWSKPRRIFVCAHGDLFAEKVPDEWIDRVFAVMALAPQHTFQVLTKRAGRMRDYITSRKAFKHRENIRWIGNVQIEKNSHYGGTIRWPLPNVWLGVSVEDQARADERIPHLMAAPTAVRFLSCEPLLGPINLRGNINREIYPHAISWVITGGESGPHARGAIREWYRSIRDQCQAAGVAYFHKQNGEFIDADEWLDGLVCGIAKNGERWRPERPLSYCDAEWLAESLGWTGRFEHHSDGSTLIRVGKHAAGRLLDGKTWSEFPDA
jgi:protein gp37